MKKNIFFKSAVSLIAAFIMAFSSVGVASDFNILSAVVASAASTKSISKCKISVASTVAYTGKEVTPKVTVKDGSKTLKNKTHYTVKYSSNKKMGTATVTVTGVKKNGYTSSKKLTFKIVPASPVVKAESTTDTVTLSWAKVKGAKKYIVYSYNTSKKEYKKLKTTSSTSYKIKDLSAGKTYVYAVKATATVNDKTVSGKLSEKISVATCPSKVKSLSNSSSTSSSVTLSWKKVSGASGYRVYSYNSSTKAYKYLKTVITNKITIKNLKSATVYRYAVKAFRKADAGTAYGSYSSVAVAVTEPAKVTSLKVEYVTDKEIKLSWKKVTGASGYNVYFYNQGDKKYVPLDSTTKNSVTLYNVAADYEYVLCVAAYKKSGSVVAEGSKSSKVTATTKSVDLSEYLDNFQKIIKSGTFAVSYRPDGTDVDMPITVYVKGSKAAMVTKMSMSEIDSSLKGNLEMRMVYQGSGKKAYALIPEYNMYMELKGEDKENISPKTQKLLFAPAAKEDAIIIKGKVCVASVPYNYVSYATEGGSVSYYFQGGQVKRINAVSGKNQSVLYVDKVSTSVDSSVFEVPSLTFWMNMGVLV